MTLKVSSLLISNSSEDSFQSPCLYYLVIRAQSSTVAHQSTDSGQGGVSVSPCLFHPSLWQPLRDSWDRPQKGGVGGLALTLHREILSFGAILQSYPLMPCKCPLQHIRRFSSESPEMGGKLKAVCACDYQKGVDNVHVSELSTHRLKQRSYSLVCNLDQLDCFTV